MSEELLKKFAQTLVEQRGKKGLTLQQISAKTRIDIKFLKAIEEGSFDVMPPVYMRAFIKDYADVLELDVVEILKAFEDAKQGKSSGESLEESVAESRKKIKSKETKVKFISPEVNEKTVAVNNSSKSNNMILIIIAGTLIVLLAVYFLFIIPSPTVIIKEKPFDKVLNENQRFEIKPEKTVPRAVDSSITPVQKAEPFSLKLIATDTVWIRLRIDNAIDKEFTLQPNEKQTISANENIKILIGNLGGIKFKLNDKDYNFNGVKGEVQNLIVSRDSIQKIKVEKIKVDE